MAYSHRRVDWQGAAGTSLKGYIQIEKRILVQLFGEPEVYDAGDKVKNEWVLEITDDEGNSGIVTIYDWKNYGMSDLPDNFSNWHVGGHSKMAPNELRELILRMSNRIKEDLGTPLIA